MQIIVSRLVPGTSQLSSPITATHTIEKTLSLAFENSITDICNRLMDTSQSDLRFPTAFDSVFLVDWSDANSIVFLEVLSFLLFEKLEVHGGPDKTTYSSVHHLLPF
jgi:hypothetical protein